MDIAWFPNNIAQNGHTVIEAMITALQARGHRIVANSLDADAAVIWSMLWAGRMRGNQDIFQQYRARNRPVIVLEVGCLRRGVLWKVGVNGVSSRQCLATSGGPGRSSLLGLALRPWQSRRGSDIMICLQRTQSQQWHGMPDQEQWVLDVIRELRSHTDRHIIVRPHPRQRLRCALPDCEIQLPVLHTGTYDDFDFDMALTRAWAVINFNSHPGTQSVIQGIPAFVDQSSVAAPVANLDLASIEDPWLPDRDTWFEDLSWTEFSIDEIRRGMPLDRLVLA